MMVFLDSDGVLADFDSRAIELLGMEAHVYEDIHGTDAMWSALNYYGDFFESLELHDDAKELVAGVVALGFNPVVLTGAPGKPHFDWAERQKVKFYQKHFPELNVVVCRAKDKCEFASKGDVIIDDFDKHMHRWKDIGGHWILHKSAKQSLKELKEYLETR